MANGGIGGGEEDAFLRCLAAIKLRRDAPLSKDDDAVAHADQFGQLRGDEQDRKALPRQIGDHYMDLRLRLYVDALCGFVENKHARMCCQPLGQNHLLLIATGKSLDRLIEATEPQTKSIEIWSHQSQLARPSYETRTRRLIDERQGGVGQDCEVHDQALPDPVFGNVGDSRLHGVARRSEGDVASIEPHLPLGRPIYAEENARDLGSATADEAREPDDFPCAKREGDIGKCAFARQMLCLQDCRPRSNIQAWIHVAERPADHELDCPLRRKDSLPAPSQSDGRPEAH